MDELEISGKRFISTRLAGKEHKYHADYIGQLIRGGKVAGQKVGRSWYVDATSLEAYLSGEAPPHEEQPSAAQEAPVVEVEPMPEPEQQREETPGEEPASEPAPESAAIYNSLMPRPLQVAHSEKKDEVKERVQQVRVHKEEEKKTEPQEKVEHHVPVKVAAAPRLRYVAEEPVFPVTLAKKKEPLSAMQEVRAAEQPAPEEKILIRPDSLPRQKRAARMLVPMITVAVAGCMVLAAAAAVSTYVISTTTVAAGQPASTGYALHFDSASL